MRTDGADPATRRTALALVCLGSFTTPLMLSSVNVAIPAISAELGGDAVLVSWIATAYLLASAVFLLPFGRLADMHGRKRVFLAGMGIVTLTSLAAATAPSLPVLIGWRGLQGVGAAMLFATGIAILSSVYPRAQRGAVLGVTVSLVYLGLAAGPLFGGWITQYLGWRAVFVYHLPLPLAAIALGALRLRGDWSGPPGQRFDWPGALLFAAAVVALMYGFSRLPAPAAWALIGAGIGALVLFVRYERDRVQPLFDVSLLLDNRVFAFSCAAALLVYSATFANSFLMSLYLQYLKGLAPAAAGVVLIAQPLAQALLSPLAGWLSDRSEPRVVASTGIACTGAGLVMLAQLDGDSALGAAVLALMTVGLGVALFASPNVNAIMGAVAPRQYGTAGGSVATVRVLGQMLSMGVATLAIAAVMGRVPMTPEHYPALGRALSASFLAGAALCAAAIALSLARGRVHG